jgi:hypothetical protein
MMAIISSDEYKKMQNEWMKKILSERKRSFFLRYGRKKLI